VTHDAVPFGAVTRTDENIGLTALASWGQIPRESEAGFQLALFGGAADQRDRDPDGTWRGTQGASFGWSCGRCFCGRPRVSRFGLAVAWETAHFGSFLFGMKPNDPTALAIAAAVMTVAAILAGYAQAWRAARIADGILPRDDPMVALRHE
jgi:hypothetical protein